MSIPARALRLNGDTSWLLKLPYYEDGAARVLNLVLDPWLDESSQIDMSFAFSVQKRVVKAVATSLARVDDMLSEDELSSGKVDAVLLSHPFTDHSHPQTLLDRTNRPDMPLLGTAQAVRSVAKLDQLPFQQRHTLPTADWTASPYRVPQSLPLPQGIRIVRLAARERLAMIRYGPAWSQLHGGVAILWQTSADDPSKFNAILYSPHGITAASIPPWLKQAERRILIHSLHRQTLPMWLAGPVALGFTNALELCLPTSFAPSLFLGTHDEHKTAGGVVARLLKREEWTEEDMVAQLRSRSSETKLQLLEAGDEIVL